MTTNDSPRGLGAVMARVKAVPSLLGSVRLPKLPSLGAITAPLLLGLGFILLAAFIVILRYVQTPSVHGHEVAYSQVLDYANEHRVASATLLSEDAMVETTLRNGTTVYASYPRSDAITSDLVLDTDGGPPCA